MAVRGLGCPVRFFLTAGQAGDAPQAQPLIEGLRAEVVMGDAAYDSDCEKFLRRRRYRSNSALAKVTVHIA